jgi:Zn-dependent protease/CBS domain-containing protein
MKASLKVGRIFGIPVYLHVTLALILPLFAYTFGVGSGTFIGFQIGFGSLPLDLAGELVLGTIAAIILFASILVHELAHSYYALRRGYRISGITLFIFGGVSQIEKAPDRAPGEGVMAFVGPLSSLAIGAIAAPFYLLLNGSSNSLAVQVIVIMLSITAFYNLFLGLFNLLPAFPMDGGRVLRASLAKRMGFLRATETAVTVGKVLAVLMAMIGFVFSIWLILIALFIYIGAGEELQSTRVHEALRGLKVRNIMTKEVSTVSPNDPVSIVQGKMMSERHMGYPVLEAEKVVGMVTLEDMLRVPEQEKTRVLVQQVMSRNVISIAPEAEAFEALEEMSTKGIGRLVVLENGAMVGIVTRTDIVKAIDMMNRAHRAGAAGPPPYGDLQK